MGNRKYDVMVMGASGFTGRLVAEYLYNKYGVGGSLKWGMAGRSREKLENVASDIGSGIPIEVADSNDLETLNILTSNSSVICTTVGPYAKYGSLLLESCVKNGSHYCDLAGEVQWMRKMIDKHHDAAVKNKVKIVHTCGFDSIPSDMGVYFMQNQAKKLHGEYCEQIKFRLKAAKGGLSGGTYASLSNVMNEARKDKAIYKVLMDPYGLNPKGLRAGPDERDLAKIIYDSDVKSWLAPFIMAGINTKVVRRAHALAGFPYGKDFRYDEAMMTGDGIKGRMKGLATGIAIGFLVGPRPGSFARKMVDRFLPETGDGPNKEERENGFFNILFWGKLPSGETMRVKVTGDKDPGYGSTCKMLGETAVSLAQDDLNNQFGLITPSVAMGDKLLNRLIENAGLTFKVL